MLCKEFLKDQKKALGHESGRSQHVIGGFNKYHISTLSESRCLYCYVWSSDNVVKIWDTRNLKVPVFNKNSQAGGQRVI
ncbi:unnamed protein product [Urochloa humidicola]